MFSEIALRLEGLSKCYHIYETPRDRLLQMLFRGRKQFYREFWALKDVSFEIRKGETVGIVGRNGSGKSTLLQLICGTLNPTGGSIETHGRIAALLELGAGFNPEFTGRENVYMNAAILGLSEAEIEQRFPEIEAFAELGEFIEQPVKTYSSGMYVRLAFSVAIHVRPQILVVDEALSVGDARFQAKCLNRIKRMREEGLSILFVSHDISSVRMLCDRAVWLDSGRIRLAGDVFPVTAQYTEYLFADQDTDVPQQTIRLEAPHDSEAAGRALENAKPITHWGTHIGTIIEAGVYDRYGKRKDVFLGREFMQVRIRFRVPPKVDRNSLSVAFSFKNLSGDDLIVSATWDDRRDCFVNDRSEYEVVFELESCLNTGKYLLVAAVEDRSAATIQYLEYVEGAQYFSTLFEEHLFGRFIPRVTQHVQL